MMRIVITLAVFLLALWTFIWYAIGYDVMRQRTLDNCLSSQHNPNICTMYMKIIEDKEYLMMEGFKQ